MTPYLSIVIVGRNDNYGVNFLSRLNNFIQSLDHQVSAFPGLIELIVVEWNPLDDQLPLKKVINPVANIDVRIITVGNDIHQTLNHSSPVLEFYGKNAGIRRARGKFVLATNPDILFTQELITEVNQQRLSVGCVYRADRYDFISDELDQVDVADYVNFATKKSFQAHLAVDNFSWSPSFNSPNTVWDLPRSIVTTKTIHTNACGDFILAAKDDFFQANGLWEGNTHRWHIDSFSLLRLLNCGLKQVVFATPLIIFHQHHERTGTPDPWNSAQAVEMGLKTGLPNWGLADHTLIESKLES